MHSHGHELGKFLLLVGLTLGGLLDLLLLHGCSLGLGNEVVIDVHVSHLLFYHVSLQFIKLIQEVFVTFLCHVSEELASLVSISLHVGDLVLEFSDVVHVGLLVELLDGSSSLFHGVDHTLVVVSAFNHHLLLLEDEGLAIEFSDFLLTHLHLLHIHEGALGVAGLLLDDGGLLELVHLDLKHLLALLDLFSLLGQSLDGGLDIHLRRLRLDLFLLSSKQILQ